MLKFDKHVLHEITLKYGYICVMRHHIISFLFLLVSSFYIVVVVRSLLCSSFFCTSWKNICIQV